MEKKILYINKKDADKLRGLRNLALIRKIKILTAAEEELNTLPEEAELLKFIGFSSQEVGSFLQDLRKLGIRVDLKCMETENNRNWSLAELYKELQEEHEYMTKGQQRRAEES
jgi:hypothetical protein